MRDVPRPKLNSRACFHNDSEVLVDGNQLKQLIVIKNMSKFI